MGVVFYLVQLTSELIIFIFICTFLLIYNFKISLLVIFTFAFFGGILFKKNAENLRLWGKKTVSFSNRPKQLNKALKFRGF